MLDEAAILAADRGASAVAAELAEQALRLTPETAHDERRRRALAAARAHQAAGEWTRARGDRDRAAAGRRSGPLRAEALVVLAELEAIDARRSRLLEEALGEAPSSPALQAVIQQPARLGDPLHGGLRRRRTTRAVPRSSSPSELDDDALRADALAVARRLRFGRRRRGGAAGRQSGRTSSPGRCGDARAAAEATLGARAHARRGRSATERARALLEARVRASGGDRDEPRSADASGTLSFVELGRAAGSSPPSTPSAHDESRLSTGSRCPSTISRSPDRRPSRSARARARDSERALELAAGAARDFIRPSTCAVSGSSRCGAETLRRGAEWLARADGARRGVGWGEPNMRWWTRRLRRGAARARSDRRGGGSPRHLGGGRASGVDREWVLAQVARCRGLVAAARGDIEEAMRAPGATRSREHEAGRRSLRPGARAARARRRSPARAAEATRPRGDRGGARRLRGSSARRAGSRERGPSSGASAGAPARRG